jgi:enamine deaminase RidA (YjgF/YER057c/UK114 family)
MRMSAEENARRLGLDLSAPLQPRPWKPCRRVGSLLFTAGHTSDILGRLGIDLNVEAGFLAAQQAMGRVLRAVRSEAASLDIVRPVKLLGFINAAPDFTDTPAVLNGASDLLNSLYGRDAGAHSRSAIGVATLPRGAAVEIEAIFEVVEL